jgi:peroxiredoxin
MMLRDDLEKQQAKWDQKLHVAYEDLVRRLGAAETADRALKVGATIPQFALPNAEGRFVVSDELLARGPLVINFFRGDWCPFCRIALQALNEATPEMAEVGAQLVAISPDTGGRLLRAKKNLNLSIDLLSDVDNGVALAFGVAFRAPEAYREVLDSLRIELKERHGNDGWFIPIPATFIVDQSGIVRYAFVEPEFVRRAEPDEIIAVLEQLSGDGPTEASAV